VLARLRGGISACDRLSQVVASGSTLLLITKRSEPSLHLGLLYSGSLTLLSALDPFRLHKPGNLAVDPAPGRSATRLVVARRLLLITGSTQ
jgi:hypothetical protein